MLFKWFPDAVVGWREAVIGGLATALLFNLGKLAIGWFIGRQGLESTYGATASLVVLLIWAPPKSCCLAPRSRACSQWPALASLIDLARTKDAAQSHASRL